MEKEGEHWEMQEHSEDLLVAFKEFFGQEAEVDVPMNTEAENVITVIAGQDDGALGAWGKVMSGVVGPDDVSEMLRVAFYEAGLPVESVDTACSVTPLNMRRLEALMDKGFGGDGEGSLGSYPDLKWVYKCADIEIKIEIGGVELKMPAKLNWSLTRTGPFLSVCVNVFVYVYLYAYTHMHTCTYVHSHYVHLMH